MENNNQNFKTREEQPYNRSSFNNFNPWDTKSGLKSLESKLETFENKLKNNEIDIDIFLNNFNKVEEEIENKSQNNNSKNIVNKKRKKKSNKKNKLIYVSFFIFLGLSTFSIFNIVNWKLDSNKTDKQINQVQKIVAVVENIDTVNTEIIENEVPKSDPYWDYIKMNLIDVDFSELKKKNSSVSGWIQVLGTNINYPFVQHSDNDFYLNHTFDKSYNKAGWVFMDYRNNNIDFDKNTIIYAHGRMDNTMFGSLRRIITGGWLSNKENYVIKLSTEYENTLWQVFSVYRIPTTADYLKTNFNTNSDFLKFGEMLLNRSAHDFNTTITEDDKILTLSTCYDDYDKVVLHAKLIKREKKQ